MLVFKRNSKITKFCSTVFFHYTVIAVASCVDPSRGNTSCTLISNCCLYVCKNMSSALSCMVASDHFWPLLSAILLLKVSQIRVCPRYVRLFTMFNLMCSRGGANHRAWGWCFCLSVAYWHMSMH